MKYIYTKPTYEQLEQKLVIALEALKHYSVELRRTHTALDADNGTTWILSDPRYSHEIALEALKLIDLA